MVKNIDAEKTSPRPPQSVQLFFASVADQVLNFRWTLFQSFDVKTPADNFLANVLQLHLLCVLIERSAAFDVGFLFDSVAFRNFNRLFSLLQMSAAIQASSRDHCSEFVLKCVLQSLHQLVVNLILALFIIARNSVSDHTWSIVASQQCIVVE